MAAETAAGTSTPLDSDALLRFFAEHGRELPWRSATPWGVLVSEVMLQQTPVARVLPVYQQWLERWPTPADLAADAAGEAVRVWGRLGYPRRALRLHATATALVERHHGEVPSAVDALLALPGIGEYTARAVAAFAFGARTPVVDTNVRRVLHRVVSGHDESGPATAADRALMEQQLPAEPGTAAAVSAAVMELGALVCTSRSPGCDRCPLRASCRWQAIGRPVGSRPKAQTWVGTDRQVRGRLMALLRDAPDPVTADTLATAWSDAEQRDRCLRGLLTDGLVESLADGRYSLPR